MAKKASRTVLKLLLLVRFVSLGGASMEPDNDVNPRLYGKTLTASDIVRATDVGQRLEGNALVTMLDSNLTMH